MKHWENDIGKKP